VKARQLPLELGHQVRFEAEDFLIAPSNERAHGAITAWPDWPAATLVLTGPTGSGKSHLAAIWAAKAKAATLDVARLTPETAEDFANRAQALLIDPLALPVNEKGLLHLVNLVAERRQSLLIVAVQPASRWAITLPDLSSRLIACPTVSVTPPDEALLRAVLIKLFSDRQLAVGPELIDYLMSRSERSFAAAHDLVDALDRAALAGQRAITIQLASDILKTFRLPADSIEPVATELS
jgi:chromosomal replication initiation ATPase DnaA